jgi:hypothetical protein
MKKSFALFVIAMLLVAQTKPAFAYLKLGVRVGGRQVVTRWNRLPVQYFISDRAAVPGVTNTDFQAAVSRAFETWQAVSSASVTYRFGGLTAAVPGQDDGSSTLGFLDRPELDRVLASTSFVIDTTTGELIESDIFFNAVFPWSVAAAGDPNRFDLESIALHEIGHLSGLGHSALGETELRDGGGRRVIASDTVMFPIAFAAGSIAGRTLKADDVAGISDLYPVSGFDAESGTISGRVTKNGQPVFGAHIVAFDPRTLEMVGNFSLSAQGEFSIGALPPGPRVLRVEPLDDADIDSFFGAAQTVDLDFRVAFVDRLVVVPRGGGAGPIEVKVAPK